MRILADFEQYTRNQHAPATCTAYKKDIYELLHFLVEHYHIIPEQLPRGLTGERLRAFVQQVQKTHRSSATLARKVSAIRFFLRFSAQVYGWDTGKLQKLLPKIDKSLPSYCSKRQFYELLQCAQRDTSVTGIRNSILLYLMYKIGLRPGTIRYITFSDIQLNLGIMRVVHKKKGAQIIELSEPLVRYLQEYEAARKDRISDYLFTAIYGKKERPLSSQAIFTILKMLIRTMQRHTKRHKHQTQQWQTSSVSSSELQSDTRTIYDKVHPRS